VIDTEMLGYLATITDLAPLHLPAALAGISALGKAFPDVPAVACFDTAFHSGMPPAASTYAIPAEWRERHGIRRYGFHGFSHSYASRMAARLLRRPETELRLVTCHLGSGASLAAVWRGRSVDTTMGFTPLEGLVMATRSGSVVPGNVALACAPRGIDRTGAQRCARSEIRLVGSGRNRGHAQPVGACLHGRRKSIARL